MKEFNKSHHKLIRRALEYFDSDFLKKNSIIFGGGTRIALELDEYRESIDIDFLCPNNDSFRAVRSTITDNSLGQLVKKEFTYPRGIRADRDGVRCGILLNDSEKIIKLEFVSFANYDLTTDTSNFFSIPALSQTSCYTTKLLANADRYNDKPYKDFFDILAMFNAWGSIPPEAWIAAEAQYGKNPILNGLIKSCEKIKNNSNEYLDIAINELDITESFAKKLINTTYPKFSEYLENLLHHNTI